MSLTAEQKAAGRSFRDAHQAALDKLPPAARCSPYIREYRHDCASRGGVSWPLRLKEREVVSEDGPFAFCWVEGTCTCGLTVRSPKGRFVVRG